MSAAEDLYRAAYDVIEDTETPPSGGGRPEDRLRRYAAFALAGTVGFGVDAGLLLVLNTLLGVDPALARIVSLVLAVSATFLINRRYTFAAEGGDAASIGRDYVRYWLVAGAMAFANYLVFVLIVVALPALPPVLALCVASAVAMVFSYVGYERFAFARGPLTPGR